MVSLRMFTTSSRVVWIATATFVSVAELAPFHSEGMPSSVFYAWQLLKCSCFLLLGFETPLAIWRFDNLNNGFIGAWLSAAVIESLQNFIPGHHFSIGELIFKSVLLSFGFTLGLIARHDEVLSLGPLHIRLIAGEKGIH